MKHHKIIISVLCLFLLQCGGSMAGGVDINDDRDRPIEVRVENAEGQSPAVKNFLTKYGIGLAIIIFCLGTGFYFFIFFGSIPNLQAVNYFAFCCIHFGIYLLFYEGILYFLFGDSVLLKKFEYALFLGIPLSLLSYIHALARNKNDLLFKVSYLPGALLIPILLFSSERVSSEIYIRSVAIHTVMIGGIIFYIGLRNRFHFSPLQFLNVSLSHLFILGAAILDVVLGTAVVDPPEIFSMGAFAFIFLNGLLIRTRLNFMQNSVQKQSQQFSEIAGYFFLTKSFRALLLSCFSLVNKKLNYDLCALELVSYYRKKISLATEKSLLSLIEELDIPSKKKGKIYRAEQEKHLLFLIPIVHLKYRKEYRGCLIVGIKKYEIEEHHLRVFDVLWMTISGQIAHLDHQSRLENLNKTLEKKVSERTYELETQYENLKILKKNQMNFFASITHDIRTPLSLVTVPLEKLINQPDIPEDKKLNILFKVKYNMYKIIQTIGVLLDMAKIELHKIAFNPAVNDMTSFLARLSEIYSEIIKDHGLKFSLNLPSEKIWVYFDPEKIEKVIDNLFNNAIKYSRTAGVIILNLSVSKDRQVKIRLRNYGKGLKHIERKKVFEPFEQASDSKGIASLGSGLGLSISKEYIELHKGKIAIFSKQNFYTEFIITLPMAQKPDEAKPDKNIVREPYPALQNLEKTKAYTQFREKEFSSQRDQIACFLLCKRSSWEDVIKNLEEEYSVQIFDDLTLEGKASDIGDCISIILLVDTLKKSHIKVIRQLKQKGKYRYIPTMLLSKKDPQTLIHKCLQEGVDECLIEPIHPMEVVLKHKLYSQLKTLLKKPVYSPDNTF